MRYRRGILNVRFPRCPFRGHSTVASCNCLRVLWQAHDRQLRDTRPTGTLRPTLPVLHLPAEKPASKPAIQSRPCPHQLQTACPSTSARLGPKICNKICNMGRLPSRRKRPDIVRPSFRPDRLHGPAISTRLIKPPGFFKADSADIDEGTLLGVASLCLCVICLGFSEPIYRPFNSVNRNAARNHYWWPT
jgi:hypothetical protein